MEPKPKTLREMYISGLDRMRRVDLDKSKSRLDYVLEQGPDLDEDRLKVPPELQDVMYSFSRYSCIQTFKDAGKMLFGSLVCAGLVYGGIEGAFALERMNSDISDLLQSVVLGLSMGPAVAGVSLLSSGVFLTGLGVKDYLELRREKWCKPLTERERTLANYVLMEDNLE